MNAGTPVQQPAQSGRRDRTPYLFSKALASATICAAACFFWVSVRAAGQTPSFNRDVVALDPAHGGTDTGARINDHVLEKDVTLEIAARLRSLLVARGFTVVATRETDPGSQGSGTMTTDLRAEAANKAHAVACLVLHATGSGNGVHVGISALGSPLAAILSNGTAPAVTSARTSGGAIPWNQAQEAYVTQSLRLADEVGTALSRSSTAVSVGRVAMRPLDNLTCPAISIELAPLHVDNSDPTPVTDADYQQRAAQAIAAALVFWRNQAQPPESISVPRTGPGL
jgi:N-acetylmuramoyl-L-alanine amidase